MKRKAADESPFHDGKPIKTENGNAPVESPHDVKKKEHATGDYSQDVKKKVSASARTGQACDRCRVRKMRCDDQQDGCAPCMQNHSECKTTDRITGKATVRGYIQSIERQLEELQHRNQYLETHLASIGEDVRLHSECDDLTTAPLVQWHEAQKADDRSSTEEGNHGLDTTNNVAQCVNHNTANGVQSKATEEHSPQLPDFRGGLAGNNYLGVSTGNSLLSSIRGTSMNVLWMEIDLADYMSADVDEPDISVAGTQPVYNKSYRAFVQTAFGISPKLSKVELPPRSEGMNYASVYFRTIHPYVPIVHKPSLMTTLTRIYDESSFVPSIAEIVMVHTMFAITYYQYAVRASHNAEHQAELNHSSNFHYHYALGFFAQLVASHTLADIQALTMLCLHVRNTPKPTACWMITSIVLDLAIELGLHRSAKRWAPSNKRSILEIEIRKRVFWSILAIHVVIAGNLGRPMALRSDDWDVEMPEAIDDDLITENTIDITKPGRCNFLAGLQSFTIMPIKMDLYNSIYAVKRSPQTYINTVLRLERRLRDWKDQWSPQLKHQSDSDDELGRVHVQYLAIWPLHLRLLLRHPSLSLTTSAEFNNENLTICMDVSRKMLHHVKQVQRYKSLDGTWQTSSLYVLAVATTLFGHWERRDQIEANDLAVLKEEMNSWLSILGDMSGMLGSGKRLQDAIQVPIDKTLLLLAQHLASKTEQDEPVPTTSINPGHPSPQTMAPAHSPKYDGYSHPHDQDAYPVPVDSAGSYDRSSNSYLPLSVNVPTPVSNPYPDSQYTYPTSYQGSTCAYTSTTYPSTDTLPATAAAATAYLNGYTPQSAPLNSNYPSNSTYGQYHSPGSPTSWRNWAGNMASNLEPGAEYMNSASALMQLGGRSEGPATHEYAVDGSTGQRWPFMLFDGVNNDGG